MNGWRTVPASIASCWISARGSIKSYGTSSDNRDFERFIGVIYRPETERWSHYSECCLPEQFDAYVWFDRTRAVTPLPAHQVGGAEETYPFGL